MVERGNIDTPKMTSQFPGLVQTLHKKWQG